MGFLECAPVLWKQLFYDSKGAISVRDIEVAFDTNQGTVFSQISVHQEVNLKHLPQRYTAVH